MNRLIKIEKIIITTEPTITGKKIKSKDTSENKITRGLDAAGGCMIFKYTIRLTATPTDRPKE